MEEQTGKPVDGAVEPENVPAWAVAVLKRLEALEAAASASAGNVNGASAERAPGAPAGLAGKGGRVLSPQAKAVRATPRRVSNGR